MNENKTNNASNYLGQIEGHLQRKLIRKNEVLKKIDLGSEKSASYYRQGRQLLLIFLNMTLWSRSTSNFYALIGQYLTGEFMQKIYAASWILFTLTAEEDRVLCQFVLFCFVLFYFFLTVFFAGCTKWNSAGIRSLLSFMASLFIEFLVEKYVACWCRKSDFRWHRFRLSPCLMHKRVEKFEAMLATW